MTSEHKDELLVINLTRLEKDAAEIARLIREWSDKLAKAEKDAKLAKQSLRVTKAELSKAVRQAPSKYGIVKITEDSTEDAVVCMNEYKIAFTTQVETEYNRDLVRAMVISLHEKGEQIGNEVKLHGQQYWAKPAGDPEFYNGVAEQTREEIMTKTGKRIKEKT